MAESTIITGQFVRISQVPASVGERILARIIDYVVIMCYIISTYYILDVLNWSAWGGGTTTFIVFMLVYLPVFCYSLLFEVFNQGQSIGKRLLGMRVVKADGTTPTLSAYLMRWLLYLFDFNITGGLGVVVIIVTKNNQRLGDLAAGTVVIKEKNYKRIQVSLDEFDYLTDSYHPRFPQAADLSLEQVNIINKTLQTSSTDRPRHVRQLVLKVMQTLDIKQPDLTDEAFLQVLVRDYQYYALQMV